MLCWYRFWSDQPDRSIARGRLTVEIYDGTQHDPLVKMSAQLNWDDLDQAEGADELLWRYMKGTEPPKKK